MRHNDGPVYVGAMSVIPMEVGVSEPNTIRYFKGRRSFMLNQLNCLVDKSACVQRRYMILVIHFTICL